MELKTLAKLAIALSAVVSLIIGLTIGLTVGKNVFETLIAAVGVSAAVYIGLVAIGYLVGIVVQTFFVFLGLHFTFKGKND
jgi:uncharacterized membrane protein AbrB (regulator of aidB expression)